jgi:hypothetical protein
MARITHGIRCWRMLQEVDGCSGLLVDRERVNRARRLIFEAEEPVSLNGTNQHTGGFDNIKPSTQGGTSAEYLRRRLRRDAPTRRDAPSPALVRMASGMRPDRVATDTRISG